MRSKLLLNGIFSTLLVLVLVTLWSEIPSIAAQMGGLDGKTFIGEFAQKGKKTEGKDELIFKDGKFHSIGCDPYGFGDGTYTSTMAGNTITFETETQSAKEGKIKWMGTVKGDTIDVTYTWYKAPKWYRISNSPVEYWFKGELKK